MKNRYHSFILALFSETLQKKKKIIGSQRLVFAVLLFFYLFFVPQQNAHCEVILSFGVYASDKPSAMVKQFRPLLNQLEVKMAARLQEKVKIKLQIASDYEKGINAIANGDVDFSRLGPVSYIKAQKINKGILIAALESKKGTKSFLGVICVHEDSGIRKIGDLKGKSFAFGNQLSTIGRYLAQQFLVEHGISASDLSRFSYLERHDKVGAAVASKHFDAGALKESTFNKLIAKGAKLKIIGSFPNVTKPWVARSGLDPSIYNAFKESLLLTADKKALKALGKDGFVEGDDNDFSLIRRAIDNNEHFF